MPALLGRGSLLRRSRVSNLGILGESAAIEQWDETICSEGICTGRIFKTLIKYIDFITGINET